MRAEGDGEATPEALRWSEERSGDETVLVFEGEIDLAVANESEAAVRSYLDRIDGGQAVIDLGSVRFLDSSGLRSLMRGCGNRSVVLRGPQPIVRRVLDVAAPGYFAVESGRELAADGPAGSPIAD